MYGRRILISEVQAWSTCATTVPHSADDVLFRLKVLCECGHRTIPRNAYTENVWTMSSSSRPHFTSVTHRVRRALQPGAAGSGTTPPRCRCCVQSRRQCGRGRRSVALITSTSDQLDRRQASAAPWLRPTFPAKHIAGPPLFPTALHGLTIRRIGVILGGLKGGRAAGDLDRVHSNANSTLIRKGGQCRASSRNCDRQAMNAIDRNWACVTFRVLRHAYALHDRTLQRSSIPIHRSPGFGPGPWLIGFLNMK